MGSSWFGMRQKALAALADCYTYHVAMAAIGHERS
jgi:hypothetical protein